MPQNPFPSLSAPSRRWLWWGLAAILIGLPLHAFFSTWLSGHLPHSAAELLKIWKDLVIAAMAVLTAYEVARQPRLLREFLNYPLTWLIGLFSVIHLVIWLVWGGSLSNTILAVKINIEFLVLYLITWLIGQSWRSDPEPALVKLILWPAAVVGLFGVAQLTILPPDFLTHFGYGANTTVPVYYIENSHIIRIISTLWGPNQLGSYLVLPIVVAVWWGLYRHRWEALPLTAVLLITLFGTQSRGAWIAAAAGVGMMILARLKTWAARLSLVVAGLIAAGLLVLAAPSHVKVYLLHSNQLGLGSINSNGGHITALTKGLDRVQQHPLGSGLEAAGRASETTPEKLYTENFYLQLAVQVGLEGLILFLAIIGYAAAELFRLGSKAGLALPLAGALVGLSLNNLVAHTWSDGATALLWWGVAGLVIGYGGQRGRV